MFIVLFGTPWLIALLKIIGSISHKKAKIFGLLLVHSTINLLKYLENVEVDSTSGTSLGEQKQTNVNVFYFR